MRNNDEKAGYSKGYQSGRRRKVHDDFSAIYESRREQFIQQMMIAIAPQIIASPWGKTVEGKFTPDRGAHAIMQTVRTIATEAAGTCLFGYYIPPAQDVDAQDDTHLKGQP